MNRNPFEGQMVGGQRVGRAAVLGGQPTWLPKGGVKWDRWGGTAPTFDIDANWGDPDAIVWPQRTVGDAVALARVAASEWAFNGPEETAVQEELRQRKDALSTVMLASGTLAEFAAYTALLAWWRHNHGDVLEGVPEVIMTAQTFNATGSTAALAGMRPVIIDIDPNTLQPTVEAVRAAITPNTVGLAAVAMFSGIAPLDEWRAIADEIGGFLFVDAAHAPFGRYGGKPFVEWAHAEIGSYQYGKVLTSGEGGSVSTNVALIAALVHQAVIGKVPVTLPDWWPAKELEELAALNLDGMSGLQGYNLRMAEPQAALLRSQLKIFDAQERRRTEQYTRFMDGLHVLGLTKDFAPIRKTGEGILYKVGLWNRTRIPSEAARRAFRLQVTGECNAPYPALSDPAGGLLLPTAPHQFAQLGVKLSKGQHPVADRAHREMLMLPGDFFLRYHAADHALHGLATLVSDEDALIRWAAEDAD